MSPSADSGPVVEVRVADDADASAFAQLRRAWTSELDPNVDDPAFEDVFARWYAEEAGQRTGWLALSDGAPVGMVNLLEFRRMPRPGRPPAAWGYVGNVYVLPAWRSQGVGRRLLDAVIAAASDRGYVRLVLNPTERSRPFYRRAGFIGADELVVLPLR